ncbi:MAG: RNA-binding S4 domain-containing protein [Deltaproteobacteria bacterium]|nr:RNA-binding S4 domain-containing protein [Deltaproteobacteria bacterium]
MGADEHAGRVRLDRWLWAARWYKTRSQATSAIAGGHVQVAGERAKPARPVRVGDEVRLRKGPYEFHIVVRGLSERRGPASVAQTLFEETEAGKAARALVAAELKAMPSPLPGLHGRPTKRDRRQLAKLFGWDEE